MATSLLLNLVAQASVVRGNTPFGLPGNEGPKYYDSACIGSGSAGGGTSGFQFEFSCPEGRVIRIHKSISYAKPKSSGCPEYYDSSREDCCIHNEGNMSHVMRKPTLCICENKDAEPRS